MRKLELPMPEMGKGLEALAKDLEARIKAHVPAEFKESINVKVFRKGDLTGLVVVYDDKAENHVYAAIEYPPGGGRGESIDPSE